MGWKYKVSVVVSIDNAGQYLEQLMRSIIMQTIGFGQNVQVIFVNDGFADGSGAVCARFCERNPDNVRQICLDRNRETGAAWNAGLEHAEGKYVTFMEPDGLWSLNAFEAAVDFLERHAPEIDLVSADMEAYGISLQQHCFNQDLDAGTLVDMNTEPGRLRVNGSCCIMKTETARGHRFQERQSGWESTIFVNQVMLEKLRYGMLPGDVRYYYHGKREDGAAVQQWEMHQMYEEHSLESLFQGIYEASMERWGCFMPMMQELMAYAVAGGFTGENSVSNAGGLCDHKMYHILQYIEDNHLVGACNVDEFTRKVMLAFKHGVDLREAAAERGKLLVQDRCLQQRRAADNANYGVLKKWFERKAQGKKTDFYFLYNGFRRIAVYGMSDLGRYLVSELRDSQVEAVYGIDRRAEKIEADIPVLQLEENLPEVDAIVVTPVYYFGEIQGSLSGKTEVPIISIEDIINVME